MFNVLNNSNNGSQKLSRSVKYMDVQPWPNASRITVTLACILGSRMILNLRKAATKNEARISRHIFELSNATAVSAA